MGTEIACMGQLLFPLVLFILDIMMMQISGIILLIYSQIKGGRIDVSPGHCTLLNFSLPQLTEVCNMQHLVREFGRV